MIHTNIQCHGHVYGDACWQQVHDLPVKQTLHLDSEIHERAISDDFGWILRSGHFADVVSSTSLIVCIRNLIFDIDSLYRLLQL